MIIITEEMNIAPGTKVKRIGGSTHGLEKGKIYTVLKKENTSIWLKEIEIDFSYSCFLFELVKTQSRRISWL